MDYEALRRHIASLHISEIPGEGNKYLVGLVPHTIVKIEEIIDDADIIWVISHDKITIKTLRETYLEQNTTSGYPMPATVDLVMDNKVLADDVTVYTLNNYNDKLVILRACQSPSTPAKNSHVSSLELLAESTTDPLAPIIRSPVCKEQAQAASVLSSGNDGSHGHRRSTSESLNELSLTGSPQLPSFDVTAENGIAYTQFLSPQLAAHGLPDKFAAHLSYLSASQDITRGQTQSDIPSEQPEHSLPIPNPAHGLDTSDLLRMACPVTLPLLNSIETKEESLSPEAIITDGDDMSTYGSDTTKTPQDHTLDHEHSVEHDTEAPLPSSPELEAREFFTAVENEMEHEPERREEFVQFDGTYMRDIYKIMDVKRLEAIVKKGLKNISILESVLQTQSSNQDARAWLAQADCLKKQAQRQRTIVGIVGNTGAGKSSVINALLGEERLVPTNCMRACTAVVTELAWNESDEPHRKYRAEIEFINEEDWKKELDILFAEMLDGNGELSRDTSNSESEAGIAYAKVKAVYPSMTKEELARASVDKLLRKPHIKSHLGSTKRIISAHADKFYRSLQQYVDTKEIDDDTSKKKGPRKPEWWPLIKCVRIYLKAEALSTGAVLVDLPGVQDSNAARAAVADGYMKQCNGLWIVAPINRAVNDKAAKKLLGDQFKRQLKFDGMFSNVTFICSKTDDISVTEAITALGLEREIGEVKAQVKALENAQKSAAAELKDADKRVAECSEKFREACDDYEIWSDLKDELAKGCKVWAPRPKPSKKRKRVQKSSQKPKKRANKVDDVLDDSIDDDDDDDDLFTILKSEEEEDDDEVQIREPLTKEEIEAKLKELKAAQKYAREQGLKFKGGKKRLREELKNIKESKKQLDDKQKAICIAARNEWSRSRIQDDYAMGIKELDQECAEQDDEENFDPDTDIRDYEQVARSLPVFCVSSRAFQTLSKRFLDDGKTPGFESVDETELPQLKEHCMKMTEENRVVSSRTFLENMTKMLLSISLWASNDGSGVKLTDEERENERRILSDRLKGLEKALDKAIDASLRGIRNAQADHIQKLYSIATSAAESAAVPTAQHWGAPTDVGGLHWATYRAVVRRDGGPYTNPRGTHDLNKQLSETFERYIVSGWEKCFQRTMPTLLRNFGKSMGMTLQKFHEKVSERARTHGVGIAGIGVMAQKLEIWEQGLNHLADNLNAIISEQQKAANREIYPVIVAAMQPAYTHGAELRGAGFFKELKKHMEGHVGSQAPHMYQECTNILDDHLRAMRSRIRADMDNSRDELFEEIRHDYMNVIAGVQLSNQQMSRAEREMRAEIYKKVQEANSLFKKLVKPDSVELVEEGEDQGDEKLEVVKAEAQDEQDAEETFNEAWFDEPETEHAGEEVTMTDDVTSTAVDADGALCSAGQPVPEPEATSAEAGDSEIVAAIGEN